MKQLMGGILVAVGILIAGASGLCTVTYAVYVVTAAVKNFSSVAANLPLVFGLPLVVGGIPFLIGLGLFHAGRKLNRND